MSEWEHEMIPRNKKYFIGYHLRTEEPDIYDPFGLETYSVDSIFIPREKLIRGFFQYPASSNLGKILIYDKLHHFGRAQKIVDGNKEEIFGEVVSKLELTMEELEKLLACQKECKIKTKEPYFQNKNTSTTQLLSILSGEGICEDYKLVNGTYIVPFHKNISNFLKKFLHK